MNNQFTYGFLLNMFSKETKQKRTQITTCDHLYIDDKPKIYNGDFYIVRSKTYGYRTNKILCRASKIKIGQEKCVKCAIIKLNPKVNWQYLENNQWEFLGYEDIYNIKTNEIWRPNNE
jgi:hypothetical protein